MKESDTTDDGFLSYSGEWHALTIGIYTGLVTYRPWSDDISEMREKYDDVDNEPWYYQGGYILGTLFQLIFIVIVLWLWVVFSP